MTIKFYLSARISTVFILILRITCTFPNLKVNPSTLLTHTTYIILQHSLYHWLLFGVDGVCQIENEDLMSFDLLLAHNDSGMRKLMEHHLHFRPIGSLSDETKVHARLLPWLRLTGWIVKWMMNDLRNELLCSIILHHIQTLHKHTLYSHSEASFSPASLEIYRKYLTDYQKALLTLRENKQKRYIVMSGKIKWLKC